MTFLGWVHKFLDLSYYLFRKTDTFPINFVPVITRSEEVFDDVSIHTSSTSSFPEAHQRHTSIGHVLQRKLSFPHQFHFNLLTKRPGALTPLFQGLPTIVKSLLDTMNKEKVCNSSGNYKRIHDSTKHTCYAE